MIEAKEKKMRELPGCRWLQPLFCSHHGTGVIPSLSPSTQHRTGSLRYGHKTPTCKSHHCTYNSTLYCFPIPQKFHSDKTYTLFLLRFIYSERRRTRNRIFSLIFFAPQCQHKIGFFMKRLRFRINVNEPLYYF